jgi:hypothetical protein
MTKTKFYLSALLLLAVSSLHAQSFQKKNKIIELGTYLSVYNTRLRDHVTHLEFTDRAASVTVPISFEYALSDKIGLQGELGFASFFTERDTNTNAIANAGGVDFIVSGNYHYVRSNKVDIFSGLGFGGASFSYESNDSRHSKLSGGGGIFMLHLVNARFYFSNHFGIKLNLDYSSFSFVNAEVSDDFGNYYKFDLYLTGTSFGGALVYKF